MIFKLLTSLLLATVAIKASEDRDTLVVRLETERPLLPIYVPQWTTPHSGLEAPYLKQLEQVLRFDLGHNGSTALLEKAGDKAFYVVSTDVIDKKLAVRLLTVHSQTVKTIEGISLTGDLGQDRRRIHKLADTIHKELFGNEGIASKRILYTLRKQHPQTKKWLSDIWEADYDGANARQLFVEIGYSVTPVAIPHTTGCLFVSYLNGQPKIYIGAGDTGTSKRLTLMRGNQLMPAISPQKDKIAFISDITGNPDLFLQPFSVEKGAIGKPQQIFAANKATQGTPTFSADGKKIAFVSNKDGAPRIYVMAIPPPGSDLKAVKATLISKASRESTAPAWSPDGTKLAYSAMTSGVRQIWIYDFDKKEEQQVTDGPAHKENPSWAPNSLHLIYNTTGPSGSELYLINLNQPHATKISVGPGEKRFPNWY